MYVCMFSKVFCSDYILKNIERDFRLLCMCLIWTSYDTMYMYICMNILDPYTLTIIASVVSCISISATFFIHFVFWFSLTFVIHQYLSTALYIWRNVSVIVHKPKRNSRYEHWEALRNNFLKVPHPNF